MSNQYVSDYRFVIQEMIAWAWNMKKNRIQ